VEYGGAWEGWSEDEARLFEKALGEIADEYGEALAQEIGEDQWVQFLYHEGMWDFELAGDYRANAYNAFVDYMMETYNMEWEDVYDWDAYREAYDSV
jgi:hypothetical protein